MHTLAVGRTSTSRSTGVPLDAATPRARKAGARPRIAIPEDACAAYASAGYEQSVQNLAGSGLDSDNVFSDGYQSQLATASGSPEEGMTLALNVGV